MTGRRLDGRINTISFRRKDRADLNFTGNSAYNILSSFTTSSKENFISFGDKAYDSIVAQMKNADGISSLSSAAKKAEQYLIFSCAVIPLYKGTDYYGLGKKLNGVVHNISGEILYFKNTTKE